MQTEIKIYACNRSVTIAYNFNNNSTIFETLTELSNILDINYRILRLIIRNQCALDDYTIHYYKNKYIFILIT